MKIGILWRPDEERVCVACNPCPGTVFLPDTGYKKSGMVATIWAVWRRIYGVADLPVVRLHGVVAVHLEPPNAVFPADGDDDEFPCAGLRPATCVS